MNVTRQRKWSPRYLVLAAAQSKVLMMGANFDSGPGLFICPDTLCRVASWPREENPKLFDKLEALIPVLAAQGYLIVGKSVMKRHFVTREMTSMSTYGLSPKGLRFLAHYVRRHGKIKWHRTVAKV